MSYTSGVWVSTPYSNINISAVKLSGYRSQKKFPGPVLVPFELNELPMNGILELQIRNCFIYSLISCLQFLFLCVCVF